MHALNKLFDKVVCINLAERPDKRELMQKKFDSLGIEVEWFTAVQYGFAKKVVGSIINGKSGHFNINQPNEIGAALSHYTVIKQALVEGKRNIFVFEDDVKFHKDFNSKFDSYMSDLPANYDVMMLYSFMYNILPENQRVSKKWMRSYKSWSLMAYGMNKRAMEEYIKRQDEFFTISDMVTYQMQENSGLNMYSAVPALCIPAANSSNIRAQANYIQNPTVINFGYADDHYED